MLNFRFFVICVGVGEVLPLPLCQREMVLGLYMRPLPACTKGSVTFVSSIKMIQLSAKRQSAA